MEYTLSLRAIENLEFSCASKVAEILLHTTEFSKTGEIEPAQIEHCLEVLKSHKKRVILVWDLLCKDLQVENLGIQIGLWVEKVEAVRFLDPGVGSYLASRYPKIKLQYSLEKGTLNKKGVLGWSKYFSLNLDRIVLSNQIPITQVKAICSSNTVDIELPGIGRIEIINSPRPLVQNQLPGLKVGRIVAASEDRPQQLSPLLDNIHGTMMYYDKDLFVLDMLEEIKDAGVKYLGLDFFNQVNLKNFNQWYLGEEWISKLKASWSNNTTRGFLRSNKTHLPLKRLTNKYLRKEKENKLGVILESVKKVHLLAELGQSIELPAWIFFYTPEGKTVKYELRWAKDLKGNKLSGYLDKGYYLFPWVKYVVPASILKVS